MVYHRRHIKARYHIPVIASAIHKSGRPYASWSIPSASTITVIAGGATHSLTLSIKFKYSHFCCSLLAGLSIVFLPVLTTRALVHLWIVGRGGYWGLKLPFVNYIPNITKVNAAPVRWAALCAFSHLREARDFKVVAVLFFQSSHIKLLRPTAIIADGIELILFKHASKRCSTHNGH